MAPRHRWLPASVAAALLAAGVAFLLMAAAGSAAPLPSKPGRPWPNIVIIPGIAVTDIATPPPLTPTPPPDVPPPPGEDLLALQAQMERAIAEDWSGGRLAVAVTDLQTGETVHVYGDRYQLSGCVANFFVLARSVADWHGDRVSIDTVDALIRQTIWASDALAAYYLYTIAGDGDPVMGVSRTRELIASLGLDEIILDHPPAFPGDTVGVDPNNWVTAIEVNRALSMLYHGQIFGEPGRSYLLEAMTNVKPGLNYLTAALPPEAVVSHKNGFFWNPDGYIDSDAGIVRFYRGGREYAYAITFLSEAVPVKYDDIPTAQELSRLAWDTFQARYP
ncbi:MAG: serine hydrolase [Dehalococcoidia bacterium]|nr:serine hydrolase [Dehalococcoidia bacterium]